KTGKTAFDLQGKMKRLANAGRIDETAGDANALPAPMAVLDRLVGDWDMDGVDLALPVTPRLNVAGPLTATKILGGRFIELRERDRSSGTEIYMILTYDIQQLKYRFWRFSSHGAPLTGQGTCNFTSGATDPMTWTFDSAVSRGFLTWDFVSDKRFDFDFKVWEKAIRSDGTSKLLASLN